MKKIIVMSLCFLVVLSCGEIGEEAKELEIESFYSKVYNATDIGIEVQDPSSADPDEKITLKNGFFEFSFRMTNNNEKAVVFTDFEVELFKSGVLVLKKDFIPQAYVANTPLSNPPGVGDPGKRFFAHLDPERDVPKQVGGFIFGKFYIDGLEKDENGLYLYEVKVTFNGFITEVLAEPVNPSDETDPFTDDQGLARRIIVFNVN